MIRDVLSDYHKNGRRKWKDAMLDDDRKKEKKRLGHITNRLSEVIFNFKIKYLIPLNNVFMFIYRNVNEGLRGLYL